MLFAALVIVGKIGLALCGLCKPLCCVFLCRWYIYPLRGRFVALWPFYAVVFVYGNAETVIQGGKGCAHVAIILLLVKVYYIAVKAALKAFKLRTVAVWVYAHAVAVFAAAVAA